MKLSFTQTTHADVLVAGAGYAGIKAAYECCKAGLKVLLVVKSKVCSGSSYYPLMTGCGCLSPKDEADKELFVQELCEAGLGMNDKKMSETFVEDIASRVSELEDMGYSVVAFPGSSIYAAAYAVRHVMEHLYVHGTTRGYMEKMYDFSGFNNLIGVQRCLELENKYLEGGRQNR